MKRINIKESDFERVNNDINGNPRFVIGWWMLSHSEIKQNYEDLLLLNRKLSLGGRKFHNKQFGGGLVFQSYNLSHTSKYINKQLNKHYKEVLKNDTV